MTIKEANSIEEVVKIITDANGDDWQGTEEGHDMAGEYAFNAAREAGHDLSDYELEAHLDILVDAGLELYDIESALHEAKSLRSDFVTEKLKEAASLEDLIEIIRYLDEHQMAELPKFGGEAPQSDDGMWSWDKSRVIWGRCADEMDIYDRADFE